MTTACLILFTKPAQPGKVKTRLIPTLGAERAAALHAALVEDLVQRLAGGCFSLRVAWALDHGQGLPGRFADEVRQQGEGLGERLFAALAEAARLGPARFRPVAAIGSDHPELDAARVDEAFARLEAGVDVVLGPSEDGGYYLIALAPRAVQPELFDGVPWSTSGVLEATLERCRRLGLRSELLAPSWDVDRPEDLDRLERELGAGRLEGEATRRLFAVWRAEAVAAEEKTRP